MTELKTCFEQLGFKNVQTYINSGNVIFEITKTSKAKLVDQCEAAIEQQFSFRVICSVITTDELQDAVAHAPVWWGKAEATSHNAMFVIAPATTQTIMNEVGDIKPEYEQVAAHGPIIFWSAPVKTFGRTRYGKITGTSAYQSITIRNANTTRKLAELTKE